MLTRPTVCVGASHTPMPVLSADWVVVFAKLEIDTPTTPSNVTMVPTELTVTKDTVPLATTFNEVPVTETTLLTDTVPVAMFETETTPVTTAVTVPVATTINPVAVAVRPLEAVVNAAPENESVPLTNADGVMLTSTVPSNVTTVPTELIVTSETVPDAVSYTHLTLPTICSV